MWFTLPSFLLTFTCWIVVTDTANAQLDCTQYQESLALDSLLQLSYVVTVNDTATGQGTFSAELVLEGNAWIALGVSENGDMVPSQAVIYLPDEKSVLKYNLSNYDVFAVLPSLPQTIQVHHKSQNESHTVVRFSKALVETNEFTIKGNGDNYFIWAYGTDNTLDYHSYTQRGKKTVTLAACNSQPSTIASDSAGGVPTTTAPTTAAPTPEPTIAPYSAPTNATQPSPSPSTTSGALDCSNFQQQVQLEDGITLSYTVNLDADDPTNGVLSAQLVYQGQAWIGFGISAENTGAMVPSDAIIGVPDEPNSQFNPGKYSLSSKSISGVNLLTSDRQTLSNHTIVQNDTHTVLTFTKILVEANEVPIVIDSSLAFIWAVGTSNTLKSHKDRRAFSLTLSACVPGQAPGTNGLTGISTPSTYRSLWSAHGILASIAWGILSPIAIGSSLLRDLIPKKGLWFKIHMFLNMTVFLFTVIAFCLAVTAQQKGTVSGASPNHFQGVTHRTVGLVIMICISLQVLGGMLRPHPPGKLDNGELEDKPLIRFMWEIIHKGSGYGLLATAWWQVQNGIKLYAARFDFKDLVPVFWGFAAGIAAVVALLYFYSKCIMESRKTKEMDILQGSPRV